MLETSVDLKIGQDQGMEHCRNKYNGYMAVINSKEEAVFLTSFLSGVTQSLTAPYAELAGFVGADWPDFTRYLEYQGAKYLGFFSSCSLKTRKKYISFARLVFLKKTNIIVNFIIQKLKSKPTSRDIHIECSNQFK